MQFQYSRGTLGVGDKTHTASNMAAYGYNARYLELKNACIPTWSKLHNGRSQNNAAESLRD